MAQKLRHQLRELGSKLQTPPASKDALVKLLKQAANSLSELDQFPLPSMLESMQPFLNAIAKEELLKHQDRDVKVLVATCICEVTRITAPEAPYSDDVLKDIFHLIVDTLSGLGDVNSPSFGRRVVILETLATYRSCVVMLDLECNDLIYEMFDTFFAVISDSHPKNVLTAMQKIMVLILDESEDIQEDLLSTILSCLGRKENDISKAARRLAMNVIEQCAGKLEPYIKQFLVPSLSGDSSYLSNPPDYHIIFDLYQCAPQILAGIIPYIMGELLADQLDARLKAVKLLGDLFALPGFSISESFQPLFSEFVKRLTDRAVEVRVSVIEHLKNCLMSNPFRPEASQIIKALCDRILDYDENVRKHVVAAVSDVSCHSFKAIPSETVRLVAERLRDKSLSVKRYTMERLADLYRHYCLKGSDDSVRSDEFEWIPGKILRCLYDKDFRSEMIELLLCGSLFPSEFSVKDKVKHWVTVFSWFDKVEVKALEQILMQKQRLQQDMLKYLSLRQTYQEDDPDLQKRISGCFWTMSRLLSDSTKSEECFQILHQLKDVNIWKILTNLLDPGTNFCQAWSSRDDLLKILGEKHPLYNFMGMLSIKCSYLLFNKEFVREILSEAAAQKSAGNAKFAVSRMNLLTVIACFSPLLFSGAEEDIVLLLKEDNEVIKEGIAHVLAKAGGTIREQLAMTSSSVDLLLERLCLEGSRKQAKYSVQALAAITKDDGLKSLSFLYKRLIDMLGERAHLPAILQSLGCIAETAMPVFETREDEVVGFIMSKILECSNITNGISMHKTEWNDMTELCLLKVYSLKTLVKSYLPVKDAHLRPGIEKLVEMLANILSFGDISKDLESSAIDKAHMRLAAAKAVLRLSRQWDNKIPVGVFYMTLRISQDISPQPRKLFLSKVLQYIKERLLDVKYACAFLLNINDCRCLEYQEAKHNLLEVFQICQQVKVRQLSVQSNIRSQAAAYPEYLLAYLVHALAHDPSCPDIDEQVKPQAFEPIYWRLHLFLSVLLHGDEGCQTGSGPNQKTESFSAVVSIFHSIKCSEDVVDRAKSKITHAICDLGQSIAKRIVQDQTSNLGISTIPLPPILYKPSEKIEGESSTDNGDQTWLGSETVLAHFEALEYEHNKKIDSGSIKDDLVVEESDGNGNEMPLGKMMKILSKKRKSIKKHKLSLNIENDVDILEVVRDINLDSSERLQSMDVANIAKEPEHIGSRRLPATNNDEEVSVSQKRKRSIDASSISMPSPKRKRSIVQRSHSKSAKGQRETPYLHSFKMDEKPHVFMGQKSSVGKDMFHSADSNSLVSCLPKINSISAKNVKKDAGRFHAEEVINNDLKEASSIPINSNKKISDSDDSRRLKGSIRKRKIRSISGLAKCSSQDTKLKGVELAGSRIKVWWPMDKKFYEGVVQSYDAGKKKHVILYDDGEVEVLHLDKEKWELVDNSHSPIKKLKSQHLSSNKEVLREKINKKSTQAGSGHYKDSLKKDRRKSTSKKHIGDNKSGNSPDLTEVDSRGCSDVSNVHPNSCAEADEVSSDEIQEKRAPPDSEVGERVETSPVDKLEEMPGEDKSVSFSSGGDKADSDEEPLNAWKVRAGKTT